MITPLKLLLILLIVLLIFGAGKLPKVMGDLGKGIRHFRSGMEGKDEEDKKALEKNKSDNDKNAA